MNYYYLFYLVPAAVAVVLYLFSKKLTAAQTASATEALEESYVNYKGNTDQLINSILKNTDWFAPVAQKTSGETILGIAECLPMKHLDDWVKKTSLNQAGRTIGKLTGVRIKQVETPFTYYLVLTVKHLHCMAFEEGICKEHVYFERKALREIKWQEASYKDVLVHEGLATPGNCHKLSFFSNDKAYTIIVNQFITKSPYQEYVSDASISLPLFALRKAFQEQLLERAIEEA